MLDLIEELYKEAYFGDLYELTIDEAVAKLYEGLADQNQASMKEIYEALCSAVEKGALSLVRGSVRKIGSYSCNPPIFNASDVVRWAEISGLNIDHDDSWSNYFSNEVELAEILKVKLESLRAQQSSGQSIQEIMKKAENKKENLEDQIISLMIENERLKANDKKQYVSTKPNNKALNNLLKMLTAMAIDGYGFDPQANKSTIPKEISDAIFRVTGEELTAESVRTWLKEACANYFKPNNKI